MNNFIRHHRRGLILSSISLPLLEIFILAFAILRDTNQLYQNYCMMLYCLAQVCAISAASSSKTSLRRLMYGIILLMMFMAMPIDAEIAIIIPTVLLLVLYVLNRWCKPNLLVSFVVGIVVMIVTGQCLHSGDGLEFTITSVCFLVSCYSVAWCVYGLHTLVNKFPEPIRYLLSGDE